MRGVGSQRSQGVSVHLGQQSLGGTTAGRTCFQISDALMSRLDALWLLLGRFCVLRAGGRCKRPRAC